MARSPDERERYPGHGLIPGQRAHARRQCVIRVTQVSWFWLLASIHDHPGNSRSGEMEGHMWRPIAVAIAVMSLFALMFWKTSLDATGDAAVAGAPPQPEHTVGSNPYLPIRRLEPVW